MINECSKDKKLSNMILMITFCDGGWKEYLIHIVLFESTLYELLALIMQLRFVACFSLWIGFLDIQQLLLSASNEHLKYHSLLQLVSLQISLF